MGKENRKLSDAEAISVIAAVKEKKWQDRINPENEPTTSSVEQEQESESEVEKEKKSTKEVEEPKRKRGKSPDYESLFVKRTGATARTGKSVYIRNDHHNLIAQLILVKGKNSLTLSDYIDNVLSHHFETFQEEIEEFYNKNFKGFSVLKKDNQ